MIEATELSEVETICRGRLTGVDCQRCLTEVIEATEVWEVMVAETICPLLPLLSVSMEAD